MVFLIGAILLASFFSIIFKLCQKYGIDSSHVIIINYFTACAASMIPIGIRILSGNATPADYSLQGPSYLFAAIQGILFVTGFTIMDYSIWRSGVALTTISARASLIIPVIMGWMLLSQPAPKWVPVALIIISMALIVLTNDIQRHDGVKVSDKSDEQRRRRAIILLIAVFTCYGVSDFNMKLSQNSVQTSLAPGQDAGSHLDALMGMIFLSATIVSIVPIILKDKQKKQPFSYKSVIGGLALGLVNIFCTSCSLRALSVLSTDIYFPLYNIGIVMVATLAGVAFFKEKIKWPQYIGIALAIVAIILFF